MAVKRRYVPDLQQMAAVYEGNFVRLNKLLPEFEEGASQTFFLSAVDVHNSDTLPVSITLKVTERFPYTSTVEVVQQGPNVPWVQQPRMLVRIYHDACSAEVTSYQRHRS